VWYIVDAQYVFVEEINVMKTLGKSLFLQKMLGILPFFSPPLLGDERGSGEDYDFTHFSILQDTPNGPF